MSVWGQLGKMYMIVLKKKKLFLFEVDLERCKRRETRKSTFWKSTRNRWILECALSSYIIKHGHFQWYAKKLDLVWVKARGIHFHFLWHQLRTALGATQRRIQRAEQEQVQSLLIMFALRFLRSICALTNNVLQGSSGNSHFEEVNFGKLFLWRFSSKEFNFLHEAHLTP